MFPSRTELALLARPHLQLHWRVTPGWKRGLKGFLTYLNPSGNWWEKYLLPLGFFSLPKWALIRLSKSRFHIKISQILLLGWIDLMAFGKAGHLIRSILELYLCSTCNYPLRARATCQRHCCSFLQQVIYLHFIYESLKILQGNTGEANCVSCCASGYTASTTSNNVSSFWGSLKNPTSIFTLWLRY